jgi:hypothetical protein
VKKLQRRSKTANLFEFILRNGNLWCIEIDDVLVFEPFATLGALKNNEGETEDETFGREGTLINHQSN